MKYLLFGIFTILGAPILSNNSLAATLRITPESVQQGDTAVVIIVSPSPKVSQASFLGKNVPFYGYRKTQFGFLAIGPTQKAGKYILSLNFEDGTKEEREIRIRSRAFAKIVLPVPKNVNLTPNQVVQQLGEARKNLAPATDATSSVLMFQRPFGLPLADNRKIGSPFGEVRKTGEEEIRHLGVDFVAPQGRSVYAINDGQVAKSYVDSVYGNSLVVSHGGGIASLYLHLEKRLVAEGEYVKRGERIGTVGSTGLSSAPHLHLSLKINGVSVDPIRFVNALGEADKISR